MPKAMNRQAFWLTGVFSQSYRPRLPVEDPSTVACCGFRSRSQQRLGCDGFPPSFLLTGRPFSYGGPAPVSRSFPILKRRFVSIGQRWNERLNCHSPSRAGMKPAPAHLGETAGGKCYLVPIHKWPIGPISALREKFNPRNVNYMPAVRFFGRLDLNPICLFVDGHNLNKFNGYQ